MSQCTNCFVMSDDSIKLCYECLEKRIKELEKIADLALDIHTRDSLNVRNKWDVCGVKAEKLLCEMIEALKGSDAKDGNKSKDI